MSLMTSRGVKWAELFTQGLMSKPNVFCRHDHQ